MEFYSFLAVLLSLVALCACDGTNARLGSGSYTDTLLNGMRRMGNRAHRTTVVKSVVGNNIYDECNAACPIGTVCSLEFGVSRCVVSPVAVVGSASYNDPILPLANDYSSPIGTGRVVVSGASGERGRRVFVNSGARYGDNFGVSGVCGSVPVECRANQLRRRSFNDVFKFTFDYSLNQCVQVSVCSTCAFVNGPTDNLFDSQFECNRSC